jgi:hypothetical protein
VNIFNRGWVSVSASTRKCEACGTVRRGLDFMGAQLSSIQICAHCLADLQIAALPALAHELTKLSQSKLEHPLVHELPQLGEGQ